MLRPGTAVKADSVILELTNPELEQELVQAEVIGVDSQHLLHQVCPHVYPPPFLLGDGFTHLA